MPSGVYPRTAFHRYFSHLGGLTSTGRKLSEETKRKISLAHKGKKLSEEHKKKLNERKRGKNHPWWGKHLPESTRRKIAESRIGEKHWNWKGGVWKYSGGSTEYGKRKYSKEQVRKQHQRYYKNNREKVLFYHRQRALRLIGLPGSHTLQEWQELKKKFDYTCLRCDKKEPEIKLTEDHIIPITKPGSTNYISNIQPLCRSCNSKKYNNTENLIEKFLKERSIYGNKTS